jgi:hypothetical protein
VQVEELHAIGTPGLAPERLFLAIAQVLMGIEIQRLQRGVGLDGARLKGPGGQIAGLLRQLVERERGDRPEGEPLGLCPRSPGQRRQSRPRHHGAETLKKTASIHVRSQVRRKNPQRRQSRRSAPRLNSS